MDIISDMTRQYKSVEEELMNRINKLDEKKRANEHQIETLEQQRNQLNQDIKDIRSSKQAEIEKYKKRIEEMSQEFAGMLKDTLETMKNKIEEADKKWEQENDGAMLKRFEEYANPKAS